MGALELMNKNGIIDGSWKGPIVNLMKLDNDSQTWLFEKPNGIWNVFMVNGEKNYNKKW